MTGYGIQAVDQKRFGQYDVEVARIDDQEVIGALEAFGWFDVEDFREAVRQAKRRPKSGLDGLFTRGGGEK
ncbi:hypothetical protein ACWX0K_20590 [Nitrobacteraceae bacterium UC4446_H13]